VDVERVEAGAGSSQEVATGTYERRRLATRRSGPYSGPASRAHGCDTHLPDWQCLAGLSTVTAQSRKHAGAERRASLGPPVPPAPH
jgi:hypothetical protein